jgi:CubicO group peptidase (beta-lactamase class C family)
MKQQAELTRRDMLRTAAIAGSALACGPSSWLADASSATIIVAEIVQRLSGLSISDYVRKEIIETLGLKSTGLGSQGFLRERIVRATVPDYQTTPISVGTASIGEDISFRGLTFLC